MAGRAARVNHAKPKISPVSKTAATLIPTAHVGAPAGKLRRITRPVLLRTRSSGEVSGVLASTFRDQARDLSGSIPRSPACRGQPLPQQFTCHQSGVTALTAHAYARTAPGTHCQAAVETIPHQTVPTASHSSATPPHAVHTAQSLRVRACHTGAADHGSPAPSHRGANTPDAPPVPPTTHPRGRTYPHRGDSGPRSDDRDMPSHLSDVALRAHPYAQVRAVRCSNAYE